MRIAYYNRFLSSPAGGGVHSRAVLNNWRADGHDVLALPGEVPPGQWRASRPDPRNSLLARLKYGALEARGLARSWAGVSDMAHRLAVFNPDVLVGRRAQFDMTLDGLSARSSAPVVAEVNAVSTREVPALGALPLTRREERRELRFLSRASLRICVTEDVRQELLAHGAPAASTVTVLNGVDPVLFSPDVEIDERVRAWRAGGPVVAFCGTFAPSLDLGTMLDAMGLVMDREPRCRFLFVGASSSRLAGPLRLRGEDPNDRVLCTGAVPHGAVPGLLAAADLFWAAFTHGRGSPLKLYEYMAMSRPVVVAGAGGSADPLEASRCGRALEKGDVEGLADAVVHYLHGETSELEAVGARGRAWVMANATWAHTARLMVLAMEKVVS